MSEFTDRVAIVTGSSSGIGEETARRLSALGATVVVPTLDGDEELEIPAGTQAGTEFRLRGQGVPSLDGRRKGDLRVFAVVRTPPRLTAEQRELYEKLLELDGEELEDRHLDGTVRVVDRRELAGRLHRLVGVDPICSSGTEAGRRHQDQHDDR